MVALCATFLVSCEKDNDINENEGSASKIVATNVINGSSQIATVKTIIWHGDDYEDYDVIAQASYKNNGFTMELPASLPAKCLLPIMYLVSSDYEGAEQLISDRTVKGNTLWGFRAYNSNDEYLGFLQYSAYSEDYDWCEAIWFYVDKDVTVLEQRGDNVNLNLKKGWNICYNSDVFFTSKKPSGFNLKWEFKEDI